MRLWRRWHPPPRRSRQRDHAAGRAIAGIVIYRRRNTFLRDDVSPGERLDWRAFVTIFARVDRKWRLWRASNAELQDWGYLLPQVENQILKNPFFTVDITMSLCEGVFTLRA